MESVSKLQEIASKDANKRENAAEVVRQTEKELMLEIDLWRDEQLKRMTEADWIAEYRWWIGKIKEEIDEIGSVSIDTPRCELMSLYLDKIEQKYTKYLANMDRQGLKNAVKEVVEFCYSNLAHTPAAPTFELLEKTTY